MNKIQIYMAATQEEYDKAIGYVRSKDEDYDIKEVGHMDTTDWTGKHLDAFVFLFSAPNEVMYEALRLNGLMA